MKRWVAIGIAMAAVVAVPAPARAGLIGGEAANSPSQRLKAIFADYWLDELRSDPLEATFVGDHRFDDRLADPSEAAYKARIEKDRLTRAALDRIDPAALSPDERIDRDVLLTTLDDKLAGERFRDHLIPISQQEGLHLKFAQAVNFHPVATVGDLENYLRRLRAFPAAVDATIVVMRQGMAERRVPPGSRWPRPSPSSGRWPSRRPRRAPCGGSSPSSPPTGPRPTAPDHRRGPRGDRRRGLAGLREARRLRRARVSPLLPGERRPLGLARRGRPLRPPRRKFTTTDLSPDEIHEIGLAEMARTRAAMEAIRVKVGFEGDLPAFFRHLKADPKFKNASEADILAGYRTIFERIDAKLPELFGRLPRTDYAIRPIEAYRAKAAAAGYYYPAPEDGSRPGYFYVNTFEPTSRSTYTMQALAYHEGVPGHHLQFSLAMEAPGRPAFRRFGYVPAFSEGWGLYSESLPREVGLYTDPYAELGQLEYDAWRCREAGRRHRPAPQALVARPGDRLPGGQHGRPPARDRERGRSLYRLAGPGPGLQDRRAEDPRDSRRGHAPAGPEIRPARLPRPPALPGLRPPERPRAIHGAGPVGRRPRESPWSFAGARGSPPAPAIEGKPAVRGWRPGSGRSAARGRRRCRSGRSRGPPRGT